jgi:hypothetical protein
VSLAAQFIAMDDALAAKAVPPLPAWWRAGKREFLTRYERDGVCELHSNVGRGGIKSVSLYKSATFFSVFGDFQIPPDERHYAIILSATKNEAEKGISIIAGYLTKLGVKFSRVGDVIELKDSPRGIRVVSASVTAASGWRCFYVGMDERAKWQAGGSDDFDAEEVATSAEAMTVTHAKAVRESVYSAWGTSGACYAAISEGSNEHRHVLGPCPTWIANPNVTEEQTHKLCHNLKRWRREYACEWQSGVSAAFDSDDVNAAFGVTLDGTYEPCRRVMLIDPSGGGSDAYTYATARWQLPPTGSTLTPKLTIDWLGGIDRVAERYTSQQIVRFITDKARERGCLTIFSDQYSKYEIASAIAATGTGIGYMPINWTASLKEQCAEHVANWLRDRTLVFGAAPEGSQFGKLRRELLEFREVVNPASGQLTFRGKKHDDFSMLIMLAAAVDLSGKFPGSPLGAARQRRAQLQRYASLVSLETSAYGSGTLDALEKLGYRPGSPQMLETMKRLAAYLRSGVDLDVALTKATQPLHAARAVRAGFIPSSAENPDGQAPRTGLSERDAQAWEAALAGKGNMAGGRDINPDELVGHYGGRR